MLEFLVELIFETSLFAFLLLNSWFWFIVTVVLWIVFVTVFSPPAMLWVCLLATIWWIFTLSISFKK